MTRVFRRTANHLRLLSVGPVGDRAPARVLRTTDEHPFWAKGSGWTAARLLAQGARLSRLGDGAATPEWRRISSDCSSR